MDCKECSGPADFNCKKCEDDLEFFNGLCLPCNLIEGRKYPKEFGRCTEVCGDGVTMGMLECDDGNLEDGDGCSSKCTVEYGWKCTIKYPYYPSECIYTIPPTLRVVEVTEDNIVLVEFSDAIDVSTGVLTSDDLGKLVC